jgi:hypothetical protein
VRHCRNRFIATVLPFRSCPCVASISAAK